MTTKVNQPYRTCDRCGKRYLRSNRTRLWVATNLGHRHGWVKVEMKICVYCMKAADAQEVARELNPKWRMFKPVEKIAAVTPPKRKETG